MKKSKDHVTQKMNYLEDKINQIRNVNGLIRMGIQSLIHVNAHVRHYSYLPLEKRREVDTMTKVGESLMVISCTGSLELVYIDGLGSQR